MIRKKKFLWAFLFGLSTLQPACKHDYIAEKKRETADVPKHQHDRHK